MSATAVEVNPGEQMRDTHEPVKGDASMSGVGDAGVDLTLTIAAPATGSNKSILIERVDWSYDAAPTGGGLTVGTGSVVIFNIDITAAGSKSVEVGRLIGKETDAVITLRSDGGTAVGKLNVTARIVESGLYWEEESESSMFLITDGFGGPKLITEGFGL